MKKDDPEFDEWFADVVQLAICEGITGNGCDMFKNGWRIYYDVGLTPRQALDEEVSGFSP